MAEIDPLAFQRSFQASQSMFDQQRQNKLQDLLMGQKMRAIDQENALASIIGNSQNYDTAGNLKREALPQIAQASPSQYGAFRQQIAQQDAAAATAQKAKREELMGWIKFSQERMANVNSPESWAAFKAEAGQVYPEFAGRLPDQYDPAQIANAQRNAVPYLEQLKMNQRQNEFAQQQDTTRRGQDMSQSTAIRGQDLADQRAREAQAAQAAKDKAPTEFQGKSATFGARAEQADKVLTDLTGKYSPFWVNAKQGAGKLWVVGGGLEALGNKAVLSKEDQQAEQAMRDFINAVLRQESGAAIAQSEFDNAARQYFPQPGDSDAVIAQKAQNRKTAIEGFKKNAGKAAYSATLTGTPAPRSGGGASGNWDAPAPNDALAELQRRAASDPAVAAKLKAMGY